MILKELVDDVSGDLQRMNTEQSVTHDAQRLRDMPDLETIMMRLQDMKVRVTPVTSSIHEEVP